jgi:hypothetical protein
MILSLFFALVITPRRVNYESTQLSGISPIFARRRIHARGRVPIRLTARLPGGFADLALRSGCCLQ